MEKQSGSGPHYLHKESEVFLEGTLMRRSQRGATLIELIFAMAIMLVLTGSFYQLFTSFYQNYEAQRMIAEMQQQGRVAVGLISREVRQAGYDPTGRVFGEIPPKNTKERRIRCGAKIKYPAERIFEATSAVFHYVADLNENSHIDNSQAGKDVDEHIKYEWVGFSGIDSCGTSRQPYTLFRDSGSGLHEVASNIESLQFDYYDAGGNLLVVPLTTLAEREQIMKVKVTVRVRTEQKELHYDSNGGYRTRQFVSEVWMKNM